MRFKVYCFKTVLRDMTLVRFPLGVSFLAIVWDFTGLPILPRICTNDCIANWETVVYCLFFSCAFRVCLWQESSESWLLDYVWIGETSGRRRRRRISTLRLLSRQENYKLNPAAKSYINILLPLIDLSNQVINWNQTHSLFALGNFTL